MKKNIFKLGSAAVLMLCAANITLAGDCKNAEEMINWAVSKQPDAMTEEYIKTAIKQCPDESLFYERAASYYMDWYERELNPNWKKEYKNLAIEFYREAANRNTGKASSQLRSKQASLVRKQEWSREVFRALTPVPPDSINEGLWLEINFELDSFLLTETAQKHLDELGEELAAKESIRISLQGHTDMYGQADYNRDLSIQRAKSAKQYLMNTFNVSPDRILTLGFGFERLANTEDPYSSANRRVEVLKIAQ